MQRHVRDVGIPLLLTACDGFFPFFPGEDPNEDPDERPSAGPPPLPPCAANDDCRGGELCVRASDDEAGVCREVCADDTECDDVFYATCDRDAGFCVHCVVDDDCQEYVVPLSKLLQPSRPDAGTENQRLLA